MRTDAAKRERERAKQLSMLIAFEDDVRPRIRAALKEVADQVAAEFEKNDAMPTTRIILLNIFRFDRILREHYRVVIDAFARRNLNMIKSHDLFIARKESDPPQLPSRFEMLVTEYINSRALKEAKLIGDTTEKDLRRIILMAQQDGLPNADIAKQIREIGGVHMSRVRSETIAITETHNAAMFGNYESASSLGEEYDIKLKKQWMAAEDSRTRQAHAEADGQVVEMDENFDVGGEQMAYPGDPSASAENVIRCRCVLGYVQ